MKTGSWRTYKGVGRISISRSNPRNAPRGYRCYRPLAPGEWFKSVEKEEYLRRFAAQLAQLDPKKVAADLQRLAGDDEPVLMCWEVAPFDEENWCHRRLVAAWLERELGQDVPELVPETAQQALPLDSTTRKPRVRTSGHNAPAKRRIAYPKSPGFPMAQRGECLPDGEHRSVKGSRGNYYTLCNHGGALFCDCPSFIFCRAPKSCKHLDGITAEQPPAEAR